MCHYVPPFVNVSFHRHDVDMKDTLRKTACSHPDTGALETYRVFCHISFPPPSPRCPRLHENKMCVGGYSAQYMRQGIATFPQLPKASPQFFVGSDLILSFSCTYERLYHHSAAFRQHIKEKQNQRHRDRRLLR